jgi:hypothetical protein
VQPASLDLLVLKVLKAQPVLKDLPDLQAHRVQLALLVQQVLKDRLVQPGRLDLKDPQDQLVLSDHKGQLVQPDLSDRKALRVLKDLLDLKVQLDLPVHKVAQPLRLLQFFVT